MKVTGDLGTKVIPHQLVALANHLRLEIFPKIKLEWKTVLVSYILLTELKCKRVHLHNQIENTTNYSHFWLQQVIKYHKRNDLTSFSNITNI